MIGAVVVWAGLLDWLEQSSGPAGYLVLVLCVAAGGVGIPIPEEAILAVGGWLASTGRLDPVATWLVAWISIVAWNLLLHHIGRTLGPRIGASWIGRRIGAERLAAGRRFFERHGVWTVAAARFVMGTRNPVALLAGAGGMPTGRFLAVVALLGIGTTLAPFLLGYHLGENLESLLAAFEFVAWAVLILATGAVVAWFVRRRRRAAS